jgi:transcriptional regulator with XRE-family HTH domain
MFPERIKALRKALDLTQDEFGKKLGASRSVVKNWEYAAVEPTEMVILHIRNTFNVSEHWLRTGEGEMFQETAQSYVEKLIAQHDMGLGGRALMRSLLRFYEELGEEATLKVIAEIVATGQEALAEKEAADFTARWLGDEESSQGSAGSA